MYVVGDTHVVDPEMTDQTSLGTQSAVTGGKSVSGKGEGWGAFCKLSYAPWPHLATLSGLLFTNYYPRTPT